MNENDLNEIIKFEKRFLDLKKQSGTHSPSIETFKHHFKDINLKVDACFLSNPYATDLILSYLQKDLFLNNKLKLAIEAYPSQQKQLRMLLSKFINVKKENIFVGNGAIEIIQVLMQEILKGKTVLPIPTFSSYYEFIKQKDNIIFYNLKEINDYELDINEFISFVKQTNASNAILINPNNPNGAYLSLENMRKLLKQLTYLDKVVIDESFIHFAYEDEALSFVDSSSLFEEFKNVIVVKSLSKDFGIAGVRLGYALMQEQIVNDLLNNGYLWNTNGIAQYILSILSEEKFSKKYEVIRKEYIKECKNFFHELRSIESLKVYPSFANFVLIELPKQIKASFFVCALLKKYGVYVRTAGDKIGLQGEYVRVAVRRKEENVIVISAIKEIMHLLLRK